ncbi:type II toxin-antitoxin system VapC family toxin [Picrophilus oshimae]|uniref:Endoribonuclease Nob1 n=1 Tax=Picrophilus torridus (strain ATCC 700027 / DSM 9790 / JCM 10055 / NBRC 100828 / KAW 2/3) TaxID=1122961 RepID=Q6L1P7_PICTO|nr:type II toxin-antitoxin system VapC family toxin [Picrophilus oshimae]AAT43105.1 zinc finger protein [Picrophilus oshimae DSM 9789]SMD30587.1 UPF0271 protein [Picrophilus oshimae DSM 9789]
MFVIDTSAILSRRISIADDNYIFTPGVISEIKKGKLKIILDSVPLNIKMPGIDSINAVIKAANETGDLHVLSNVDIEVIAMAYEIHGIIISDDYAIQNVARHMHIKYEGADLKTIDKKLKWRYRCTGCRRVYNDYIETCPVCGHKTKRFTYK